MITEKNMNDAAAPGSRTGSMRPLESETALELIIGKAASLSSAIRCASYVSGG